MPMNMINLTPEHGGETGLVIRASITDISTGKSQSTMYEVTWDEGRRLLSNLVSILNGHHASLE